ncbi:hypothetical protein DFH08DRAFT_868297 [Mycena albidolilacea]|uniref:Cullin N-terminal domain-containing protein n=1 Tax=Mycena albidolilacea TaxID=1033008 RepID=A0AAD7A1E6_9AGAR|nr:hypothetical protein DFH08DRAFT_868297 [Mycena albidolilacea]
MSSKPATGSGARDVWVNDVEPTILQVFAGGEPISLETRIAVYTAVYNCMTKSNASSADFYVQIQSFFTEYTTRIATAAPADDSTLPEYYDAEWARFSPGVKFVNRLLDFTNRHYVKRVRDEGHLDILTVRNLAFKSWKNHVFEALLLRLENSNTVEKARLERIRTLFEAPELNQESLGNMHLSAC